MKEKEDKGLKPDGKFSFHDVEESHPDFHNEYLDMSEEFFKKENPSYYALMQKFRANNVDQEAT